jgi:hypothetical protein
MNKNSMLVKLTVKREWFPAPQQMLIAPNSSYLHSLFVGITMPFLNLPVMIWQMILKPASKALVVIFTVFVISFFSGITGRSNAYSVKRDDDA